MPLHSTREDVERLLGKPNATYGRYEFDKERAEISYSTGLCVNGWKVPVGTVIDIVVSPKESLRISDLKVDLRKYERVRDPKVTSHVYYANRDDGLRYVAYEPEGTTDGKILTTYYESTTEDVRNLYCKSKDEIIRAEPAKRPKRGQPCNSVSDGEVAAARKSISSASTYSEQERSVTILRANAKVSQARAKEWCGITPLKSTRTRVERILGTPSSERLPAYHLPDEIVYVDFAANPGCRTQLSRQTWNVPEGTVTLIRRFLKKPIPLKSLDIDLSKFKKVKSDNDVEGHFYYVNEGEGFTVEFEAKPDGKDEFVTGYIYAPRANQKRLRCPVK